MAGSSSEGSESEEEEESAEEEFVPPQHTFAEMEAEHNPSEAPEGEEEVNENKRPASGEIFLPRYLTCTFCCGVTLRGLLVCKVCRTFLRAEQLSSVEELNAVVTQYEHDMQVQVEYVERGKRTDEARQRRSVKHHTYKAWKWNQQPGELDRTQTVKQRYRADERYRESMREVGWTDEDIGDMDELYEAIQAYDEVKDEERAQIAMWQSRGRETSASAAELPKGRQKGLKGGWIGTGQRTEEEITRSGRWLVREPEDEGPGEPYRYATEDQWTRAQRYEHQALYRMPDPDSETRASDFEGYSRSWWAPSWSGRGRRDWQWWD